MENSLQIFNNPEFGEIRTAVIDGVIYFVGEDIGNILGYASLVDAEDSLIWDVPTNNGVQTMTFINESGLYNLIHSSKMPNAKKFKRWVTSEVLPSIRKRGVYATDDFIQQTISNPKWAIDVLTAYQEEKDKNAALVQENAVLSQRVDKLQKNHTLEIEISTLTRSDFDSSDELIQKIFDTYSGKCDVHIKVIGLHI